MNNRIKSELLGLAMLSALMPTSSNNRSVGREYCPEDDKPKQKPIPNGCKKYIFYGIEVVAMSEKSALKKCKRLFDDKKKK